MINLINYSYNTFNFKKEIMNPFNKFNRWFKIAKKYEFDHTAFALSTCDNRKPYVRMVLLKKIVKDGFIFFTNLESSKGKQFQKIIIYRCVFIGKVCKNK